MRHKFCKVLFGKSNAKDHVNCGQMEICRYCKKDRVTRKHYYKILQI